MILILLVVFMVTLYLFGVKFTGCAVRLLNLGRKLQKIRQILFFVFVAFFLLDALLRYWLQ